MTTRNNKGLWLTSFQQGLARDLPTDYPGEGNLAMYYATDTGALYVSGSPDAIPGNASWQTAFAGANTPAQLPVMTVSGGTHNLPAAATANTGQMAYVTDLSSITIGATAAHGSTGAAICVSDGTNWIVGGVPAQA